MPSYQDKRPTMTAFDNSGRDAIPGSREWILYHRSLLRDCMVDLRLNAKIAKTTYEDIKIYGGWQYLENTRKRPFHSFDEFCRDMNGLGVERAEFERRLSAQELAQTESPAADVIHAGPGRGKKKTGANGTGFSHGSNQARTLVRRLKRDRPDIAERLANGEFKSARAAAIAAGIVIPRTSFEQLQRYWKRATAAERKEFLIWVNTK